MSSFIGRERELEQTVAALGAARVVTLTGPGGVGKTRLALEVAGQVAPRFADGAWLCELAPVRDPAGVDDAVAAVFSVTARAGQGTRETLVEFLRSKQLLLVLDNCEHVLGRSGGAGRGAGAVVRAAGDPGDQPRGPGDRGGTSGAGAAAGVPGPAPTCRRSREAEAVRLFAERAAAVKPGFAVTAENAAAVAAVVRRLDGIALAIELAAARVPAMTPAELARRLERSFAVLAAADAARWNVTRRCGPRSTGPSTCSPGPSSSCWPGWRCSPAAATLEAAEAVCGGEGIDPDAVFELLASLVARSLVVAEEHGPQTRYRLLETIRQYGEERLNEAGEADRWRARHAG